jgi:hypothetical protein
MSEAHSVIRGLGAGCQTNAGSDSHEDKTIIPARAMMANIFFMIINFGL